jgi:hypothetical protein
MPRTFTLVVTFTVTDPDRDGLRDEQAIRDEVRSWLESLRAQVRKLSVRRESQS